MTKIAQNPLIRLRTGFVVIFGEILGIFIEFCELTTIQGFIITLDVTKTDVNRFRSSQKIQRQNFQMNIWIILSQILNLKKKNLNSPVHKQRIGTVPSI